MSEVSPGTTPLREPACCSHRPCPSHRREQSVRLWASATSAEVEWTVGPVDVSDGQSHEVITRYAAPLDTGGAWATDANCREAQPRVRGARTNWTVALSEPVSGNYYPVNCVVREDCAAGGWSGVHNTSPPSDASHALAGTTGAMANATLAIAVDRSQGGTSITDGTLELMTHRRMLFDDGRGVGEALNEPGVDGKGLITRGRHWLVAAPPDAAPALYKAAHLRALSLPTAVAAVAPLGGLTPEQWTRRYRTGASLLSEPLPPALHLTTAQPLNGTALLLRLSHMYDAGEDPVLSLPASVDLATLLSGWPLVSAVDMTLPGSLPLASVPRQTYRTDAGGVFETPVLPAAPSGPSLTVTLGPQETRTFVCSIV